jgi:hypothetical protein
VANVNVQITERTQAGEVPNTLSNLKVGAAGVSFDIKSAAVTWDIERAQQIGGTWTKIGQATVPPGTRGLNLSTVQFHDTNPPPSGAFYRASMDGGGGDGGPKK